MVHSLATAKIFDQWDDVYENTLYDHTDRRDNSKNLLCIWGRGTVNILMVSFFFLSPSEIFLVTRFSDLRNKLPCLTRKKRTIFTKYFPLYYYASLLWPFLILRQTAWLPSIWLCRVWYFSKFWRRKKNQADMVMRGRQMQTVHPPSQ